jgi:hypothetical protein
LEILARQAGGPVCEAVVIEGACDAAGLARARRLVAGQGGEIAFGPAPSEEARLFSLTIAAPSAKD